MPSAMNVQRISLDLSKASGPAKVVRLGQGDRSGTTIVATVYDNGTLASVGSLSARFCMRLPGGRTYVRDSGCTTSGNSITYVVDETVCCSVHGVTNDAYFELLSGSTVIYSTERFVVEVMRSVTSGSLPAEAYESAIETALAERATRTYVDGKVDDLESEISSLREAVNAKASAGALASLSSAYESDMRAVTGSLSSKASSSDLSALASEHDADVASLEEAVGGKASTQSLNALSDAVDDLREGVYGMLANKAPKTGLDDLTEQHRSDVSRLMDEIDTKASTATVTSLSKWVETNSEILSTKASKASPAFTGTPTAPTPAAGDSSGRIATTAFVADATASMRINLVSIAPPEAVAALL